MSETITIKVKEGTARKLQQLKRVDDESYDSVVSMLVANYDGTIGERWTKAEIEAIARQVCDDGGDA